VKAIRSRPTSPPCASCTTERATARRRSRRLLAACGRVAAARRGVLLVVLDACHGDALAAGGDPRLTPALGRVAAAGRADRACADATWTLPATTSLLTGWFEHHACDARQRTGRAAVGVAETCRRGLAPRASCRMVYASDAYGLSRLRGLSLLRRREKRTTSSPPTRGLAGRARHRAHLPLSTRGGRTVLQPEELALKRGRRSRRAGGRPHSARGPQGPRPPPPRLASERSRSSAQSSPPSTSARAAAGRALADPATVVVTADHGEALGTAPSPRRVSGPRR
jgi:hypothetical protein